MDAEIFLKLGKYLRRNPKVFDDTVQRFSELLYARRARIQTMFFFETMKTGVGRVAGLSTLAKFSSSSKKFVSLPDTGIPLVAHLASLWMRTLPVSMGYLAWLSTSSTPC